MTRITLPKVRIPFGRGRAAGAGPGKGAFADYVPIITLVLGFTLIGLGWNGAASVDFTQGQIPYLISGGLLGLGLVFFSAAALIVQTIKKGQALQNAELSSINRTLERLASRMSMAGNGQVSNGELVIAGSASFHLSTCRVVGNRPNPLRVSREEAVSDGLEPCRICNP